MKPITVLLLTLTVSGLAALQVQKACSSRSEAFSRSSLAAAKTEASAVQKALEAPKENREAPDLKRVAPKAEPKRNSVPASAHLWLT